MTSRERGIAMLVRCFERQQGDMVYVDTHDTGSRGHETPDRGEIHAPIDTGLEAITP